MKYPKIDTVWKRDENNKNKIIEGDFSKPEFDNIKKWLITEKIDGTNIRITYDGTTVTFDGRGDDAQMPVHLYRALQSIFPLERFQSAFAASPERPAPGRIILFGEGYGAKINGGGLYRDDNGFILFDVWIDGFWLNRENVEDIAKKLNIPVVPTLGIMTLEEAVGLVKTNPISEISNKPRVAEGIVARSYPMMMFRNGGDPIMWKLKVKDYK